MQHTEKKTKTVIKVSWCKLFYINNITLQRKKDKYFNAARGENHTKASPATARSERGCQSSFPCAGAKPPLPARETGRQRTLPLQALGLLRTFFLPQNMQPCPLASLPTSLRTLVSPQERHTVEPFDCERQHPKPGREMSSFQVWLAIRNNCIVLFSSTPFG